MIIRQIINNYLDRIQHKHEPWDRYFQIPTYGSLEAFDFNICDCFGDTQLVNKRKYGTGRNTTATEGRESVEARVIPGSNELLFDEFVDFSFGKNGATDVEATVSGGLH